MDAPQSAICSSRSLDPTGDGQSALRYPAVVSNRENTTAFGRQSRDSSTDLRSRTTSAIAPSTISHARAALQSPITQPTNHQRYPFPRLLHWRFGGRRPRCARTTPFMGPDPKNLHIRRIERPTIGDFDRKPDVGITKSLRNERMSGRIGKVKNVGLGRSGRHILHLAKRGSKLHPRRGSMDCHGRQDSGVELPILRHRL